MNKEQYNTIIENAVMFEFNDNCDSGLSMVKSILILMGIPLPHGTLRDVFNILRTNNYMSWRLCTFQEAQNLANNGVPAIGVSTNKISILKEASEESPVIKSEKVISLTESTDVFSVSDMLFYAYTAVRTSGNQYGYDGWSSLDAAMNYYGRDFTYTYCGGYYNYYYTFSDGSRMYFRVV